MSFGFIVLINWRSVLYVQLCFVGAEIRVYNQIHNKDLNMPYRSKFNELCNVGFVVLLFTMLYLHNSLKIDTRGSDFVNFLFITYGRA